MGQPELSETFDTASIQGLDDVFVTEQVEPVTVLEEPAPDPVPEPITAILEPETEPVLKTEGVPIDQAAKLLGISTAALKKRLRRGTIQGNKVETKHGEKWFVSSQELEGSEQVEPVTVLEEPAPDPVPEPITAILEPETEPVPEHIESEDSLEQSNRFSSDFRLLDVIENQAHQLKAAGDVIMYLRSQLEEKDSQIKLLTDSQHNAGWWARFCSWFTMSKR